MTKGEAAKIRNAARRWAACAHLHGVGTLDYSRMSQRENELLALLDSMEDQQMRKVEPQIAAATKATYVTRCPACHAKIEWVEPGTKVSVQTPPELAAENAQCNAAYLAKKTDEPSI